MRWVVRREAVVVNHACHAIPVEHSETYIFICYNHISGAIPPKYWNQLNHPGGVLQSIGLTVQSYQWRHSIEAVQVKTTGRLPSQNQHPTFFTVSPKNVLRQRARENHGIYLLCLCKNELWTLKSCSFVTTACVFACRTWLKATTQRDRSDKFKSSGRRIFS